MDYAEFVAEVQKMVRANDLERLMVSGIPAQRVPSDVASWRS